MIKDDDLQLVALYYVLTDVPASVTNESLSRSIVAGWKETQKDKSSFAQFSIEKWGELCPNS
ncbi:MAG: hypothetical protein Q8K36_03175 [Alphaproteobacteria bacterium]|nr:hypothetical protein [Alphaproteobacteria bacterium]